MKTDLIIDAIKLLRPSSEFVIFGGDYDTIEWHKLEGSAPTKQELLAAAEEIEAIRIAEAAEKAASKAAVLARLNITEDEAKLLLS